MDYTKEELQGMKRADLQKLCKKIGIRANMKTEKLIGELVKYFSVTNLEKEKACLPECNEVIIDKPVTTINDKSNTDVVQEEIKSETEELSDLPVKRKSESKTNNAPVKAVSKIPRLTSKPDKKNADCKTPTTNGKRKTPKRNEPKDWTKIHQKQFDKMDSLDVYLSKKHKRAEDLGSSAKKIKVPVLPEEKQTKVIQRPKPSRAKSIPAKPKPTVTVVTPKPSKESLNNKKRLTFNFLPSQKENVTPDQGKRRATLNDHVQKPGTPFRFTGNAMPFGSPTPRKKFDLQASLAKPLPYKPYSGKLPTPTYAKQTPKMKKTSAKKLHQKDLKAVKTRSHNERRKRQINAQSRARETAVSRRRGLIA